MSIENKALGKQVTELLLTRQTGERRRLGREEFDTAVDPLLSEVSAHFFGEAEEHLRSSGIVRQDVEAVIELVEILRLARRVLDPLPVHIAIA